MQAAINRNRICKLIFVLPAPQPIVHFLRSYLHHTYFVQYSGIIYSTSSSRHVALGNNGFSDRAPTLCPGVRTYLPIALYSHILYCYSYLVHPIRLTLSPSERCHLPCKYSLLCAFLQVPICLCWLGRASCTWQFRGWLLGGGETRGAGTDAAVRRTIFLARNDGGGDWLLFCYGWKLVPWTTMFKMVLKERAPPPLDFFLERWVAWIHSFNLLESLPELSTFLLKSPRLFSVVWQPTSLPPSNQI